MVFTKEQVYSTCKIIAPEYDFDPNLIYAICLQESEQYRNQLQRHLKTAIKIGDKQMENNIRKLLSDAPPGSFAADVGRLEPAYYLKYVEYFSLATTTEILLAASYGIMQIMGQSLREAGFFNWYFENQSEGMKGYLGSPLSEIAVPKALNKIVVKVDWMIEWGCKWLSKKREIAKGDIEKMLTYYNGSSKYPGHVLPKFEKVKQGYYV